MPRIVFEENRLHCEPGENLLDCLLRHGHSIPYGCRAGACQSCLVQLEQGQPPSQAQASLTPSQRQDGLLLSCQCQPDTALTISRYSLKNKIITSSVLEKTQLSETVLRLRLRPQGPWRAGQYINLWLNEKSQSRCYSIASVASEDPFLELHIGLHPHGYLSPTLFYDCMVGDNIAWQGPIGEFVYRDDLPQDNILLLAEGTGLAPLLGICREALLTNPSTNIELLCTDSKPSEYYGTDLLMQLKKQYPQLAFGVIEKTKNAEPYRATTTSLKARFSSLRDYSVYICGGPKYVETLQRQCFMAGATRSNILIEKFLDFSSA
ncbi:flavodoxin reductase family protein [Spongiibacter sp. IMCC21906]|uniref:2Fe-2S iron-sulfur cluster-binding protein n=1 Tax=Spongiibacter sp. IMCC21906 TaxID=1620392 RepID=UPI00062DE5A2|nr:2Fe-2S iron-sulfur cluster-binding protein [Spongiibacter sp. IMCC21906]AKH70132.1 flavodoxin reductase family protein [Spongiibacter sp. IMCC21906]